MKARIGPMAKLECLCSKKNSFYLTNLYLFLGWADIEPSSPEYNLEHLEDLLLSVHPYSQEIHACLIILQAYS